MGEHALNRGVAVLFLEWTLSQKENPELSVVEVLT